MNIFAHLIMLNVISYKVAIEWAYINFTNLKSAPWLEEITLANDNSDILRVLCQNFEIKENSDIEKLKAGIVANDYFNKKITLDKALYQILYNAFIDYTGPEKSILYEAEDLNEYISVVKAEEKAYPILKELTEYYTKYHNKYIA